MTIDEIFDIEGMIDATISLDTSKMLLKEAKVTACIPNGVKPVFRLTTQTGRETTATANHPFFSEIKEWVWLQDLKVGDTIAVPRRLDVFGKETWSKQEIAALAILVSRVVWGFEAHPEIENSWATGYKMLCQRIPEYTEQKVFTELPKEVFTP